jgi:hypothetical protein
MGGQPVACGGQQAARPEGVMPPASWLVYVPLGLAILSFAASWGVVWNNQGKIASLEAQLSARSAFLPAQITANRLDRIEAAVNGIPQRADLLLRQQLQDEINLGSVNQDISGLKTKVDILREDFTRFREEEFQRNLQKDKK